MMTPLELKNRVLRWLWYPTMAWEINGRRYRFQDGRHSITPLIVWKEIKTGLYDINLQPGETFLDIGGHIGMTTIPLATVYPGVRFIVYEPNRRNFLNLQRNVLRAKLRNVEMVNAGLAPKPCMLWDHHHSWNTGGSTVIAERAGIVPGYPLSEIFRRHGLADGCTVVKVDCEGGEFGGSITPQDISRIEFLVAEVHGHLGPALPFVQMVERYSPGYRLKVIGGTPYDGLYTPKSRPMVNIDEKPTVLDEIRQKV